jgi:hypothetical protein
VLIYVINKIIIIGILDIVYDDAYADDVQKIFTFFMAFVRNLIFGF